MWQETRLVIFFYIKNMQYAKKIIFVYVKKCIYVQKSLVLLFLIYNFDRIIISCFARTRTSKDWIRVFVA